MIKDDLRHALDPAAFAIVTLNFHSESWQLGVLRWSGRRMLSNCSRQNGKSTIAILALHRALFYPHSLILLVTHKLYKTR
jgi:hypothetical protein